MTFSENAKTYLKFSAVLKISRNDKFKDDLGRHSYIFVMIKDIYLEHLGQ